MGYYRSYTQTYKKTKKTQVCNTFYRICIKKTKMFFFEAYVCKIISYDLINTFFYQNLTEIPRLKKITLNFGYQKSNFKHLVSSLLALEFITSRKGKMTTSRHLNVFLKIKKGNPVGCKIILTKSTMFFFPKINIFYFSKN